jgi:uncharacterized protein YoxC
MAKVKGDIDTEFGDLAGAMKQQQNTSGMDVLSEDGSVAKGMKLNPETGETYYTEPQEEANKIKQEGMVKLIPNESDKRTKQRQEDAEKLKGLAFDKEGNLDLNKINLPGMPNFGLNSAQKVPKTSEAQPKADENQSDAETARLNRSGNKAQAQVQSKPQDQTQTSTSKKEKSATLDDVVSSLNQLNKQMSTLISQQESLMAKQISATSSNASNILDKMRPR